MDRPQRFDHGRKAFAHCVLTRSGFPSPTVNSGTVHVATRVESSPALNEGRWLPASGDVIAGRFRVERTIGEGGMGAVVSAEHIGMGGKVAIKFLHPHLAVEGESHERFIREAKVASQIRSEHVVRVL